MDKKRFFGALGRYIPLTLWAIFALFPLFWMLLITFKSDAQMYNTTFIFSPTLENYKAVLTSSDYIQCFIDNIIVSAGAVIVAVLFGVPAAYALARYNFKGKEDLAFQILSYRFAPEILVVLPIFLIFQKIRIYDTYFGLIWVYQLIAMPLIIWVVRGYFEDISIEIEQAAQVDGYKWYQIFIKILLPLVKPGLVAAALLAFIFAWNNFTFSLLLTSFHVQTVTISALRYIATDTVHYGQMAVAATIAVLPEVIMALCIQKHLVRGLSFGAVKG
ncbi:MAG: carbohydrate ABC transporter permease [Flexilinea sp.]|jgi:multiple sugar transport system permease protein